MTDNETVDEIVWQKALSLLARREHSQAELRRKLSARGYPQADIEAALTDLAEQGLQDDARFAESYVRSRYQRGQGSRKITAALYERGVAGELVQRAVYENQLDWQALAAEVYAKKYPAAKSLAGGTLSATEQAKRARFLRQRGFSDAHIWALLRGTQGG